ncbi:bifunctional 2-polyprenyl-6-hydroxyphenol methylase/3-demethylubiquinol 3-O-methyltransferase UbiG [Sphingobium sufflavum]|uniref:bifunctional 2-polyprenyl-6-hydroxyphenol methylase/3-demethylubiquinol 3-O-methyltransferase UbiG n=1 Tax=Sphingobium sufflavum TaxID=1129547 RepID=UPI001F3B48CB|nr:bifunctional 2-polyprenyl-6-hydroxyphenol methylase/3-demethylubiquinol 3-O-methyltransferase UbiG [Sphingobium sufflavum]MCE7798758.1 bifunctional 2-polyprenyl-6-hydroxyphenol methylase/3-demethylubiquinol 3-O-methyltransferase UbiG [Sphingobium sufflavum]
MASNADKSTIRPDEVAHFSTLSADWWNPRGSSAMLHKLNPVRLAYIRERVDAHWSLDHHNIRPLAGRRALDVGCGAGLLCEPLARLGAAVTGIDATPANITVASAHADKGRLPIDYRTGSVETMTDAPYDLVTCMEVVEHVEDPALFIGHLARLVAPGGLLILSTPNRTPLSRLTMITIGEGLNLVPRGTHDWHRFLTPDEMEAHLTASSMQVIDREGIAFRPDRGFQRSPDMGINYLMTAVPLA